MQEVVACLSRDCISVIVLDAGATLDNTATNIIVEVLLAGQGY